MTMFYEWEKRVGSVAIFEDLNQMTNRDVTLNDDTIFALVDAGFDGTAFVFSNGRFSCTVDDWLECKSDVGVRTMPLKLMDRW